MLSWMICSRTCASEGSAAHCASATVVPTTKAMRTAPSLACGIAPRTDGFARPACLCAAKEGKRFQGGRSPVDSTSVDAQLRQAAFDHVNRLTAMRGGILDSGDLAAGFDFRGERIPLVNPQRGIF